MPACDADAIDAKRLDEVIEQLGAALPDWGHAVSRVIDQVCRLAAVRRGLQNGGWDDASLSTLQSLVRDIDTVRGSLEDTEALKDDLAAARRPTSKPSRSTGNRRAASMPRPASCSGASRRPTCRSACSTRRCMRSGGR